jgi:DNA polymerase elongation subunit (family B)
MLSPDIITGFNDSNFDWEFVVYKAYFYGKLPYFINMVSPDEDKRLTTIYNASAKYYEILLNHTVPYSKYITFYLQYTSPNCPRNLEIPQELVNIDNDESQILFDKHGELGLYWTECLKLPRTTLAEILRKTKSFEVDTLIAKQKLQPEQSVRVKELIEQYKCLKQLFGFMGKGPERDLAKNYFQYRQRVTIKLMADRSFTANYLKIPGCLSIDTRACCMKLHPKNETSGKSSLNSFLKLAGLNSKDDMPYIEMFKLYAAAKYDKHIDVAGIGRVIKYCLVDAVRCQELLLKWNVLDSYRETSALVYVSLQDSYLIANGMKVRNLAAMTMFHSGILFNMIPKPYTGPKDKYPGAYVLNPIKRLVPDAGRQNKLAEMKGKVKDVDELLDEMSEEMRYDRPITGLDFSSLYPSIMMAYNLSPETIILNEVDKNKCLEEGLELRDIDFEYAGKHYRAWTVFHNNIKEKIGIFPTILIELFAMRANIKKSLNDLKGAMERIHKYKSEGTDPLLDSDIARRCAGRELEDLISTYEYEISMLDTKQIAVKLVMNTFYGEAGNNKSSMFLLELAVGVTSSGQKNIKAVKEFVEAAGFLVTYGDTDSLYLSPGNDVYREFDRRYLLDASYSKLDYWTDQVKATMVAVKDMQGRVNKFLADRSGTNYLKMAYEEVLFPAVFTGKKKYFGTPHEGEVNFNIRKKPFIKGIDIVKQGISPMAVFIGYEVISQCRSIDNTLTVREIVFDVINRAIKRDWSYEDFALSACYKPTKKNVPVLTFVSEMRRRGLRIPETGERFKYVVVKRDMRMNFTSFGTKNELSKGFRMEYLDYARDNKLKIDTFYYFEKSVAGICARFINFDPIYKKMEVITDEAPANADDDDDNELEEESDDEDDVELQKNAKKDLISYFKKNSDEDPEEATRIKEELKAKYKYKQELAQYLYCGKLPDEITKCLFKTNKKKVKHYEEIALSSDIGNIAELASNDWAVDNEEKIISICKTIHFMFN